MRSARAKLADARALNRAARNLCECGNPRPPKSAWGCAECQRKYREFMDSERSTTAVLRAIRNHEGLSAVEIASNANVTIEECSSALSWLKKDGAIVSCVEKGFGMVYRLKEQRRAA